MFRRQVHCNGEIPQSLSAACVSCIGQTVYLFGGHCEAYGHCNDVSTYNSLLMFIIIWQYRLLPVKSCAVIGC